MGAVLMEGVITLLLVMDGVALRMPAMKLVNFVRMGKGPFIVKVLAGFTLINLASTLHGIYKIQRRSSKMGSPTAADHFILRTYLLESFLEGSFLLLLLVIRQLYHNFCPVDLLKSKLEALKEQCQAAQNELTCLQREYNHLQAEKNGRIERERRKAQKEIGSLKDIVAELRQKMENLKLESLQKDKVVKAAEANSRALQKQSEGLLLEYDRLLDDNENLRSQLVSIDRRLSYSDTKKSS